MKSAEKLMVLFAILVVLGIACYRYSTKSSQNSIKQTTNSVAKKEIINNNLELSYIVDVINNGSNRLNFKGGEMEGGFVPKSKAKDVACYILALRGKPCKNGYSKDAPLYFSSNCAGCHGIDAKGIKGSFPSLVNKELLGFKKWLKEIK